MASFIDSNGTTLAVAQQGALGKKGHSSISGVAEEDLEAGLFVTPGAAADGLIAPTSTAEVADCVGVTLRIATKEETGAAGEQYADNDVVEAVFNGFIYAKGEEAMAVGDPVFVRYSGGTPGAVRNDDPGTAAAQLTGVSVAAASSGAGPVLLKVNI